MNISPVVLNMRKYSLNFNKTFPYPVSMLQNFGIIFFMLQFVYGSPTCLHESPLSCSWKSPFQKGKEASLDDLCLSLILGYLARTSQRTTKDTKLFFYPIFYSVVFLVVTWYKCSLLFYYYIYSSLLSNRRSFIGICSSCNFLPPIKFVSYKK